MLTMDCDVEEVPSTDSKLTESADSASASKCSSSISSTLSSISNSSWTLTAKKLQNGGRTPKSFVYFTKNRNNTHAVCTLCKLPSKSELKLNKSGATSHLISHISHRSS